MSKHSHFLPVLILALAGSCLAATPALEAPGVGNFHQVGEHIYRGAQPTPAGIRSLAKLGVKTVIDLRGESHAPAEEKLVEAAGMRYIHVPMAGFGAPSEKQISEVFAQLDDSAGWPVFVHCRRGADRTGTVIACYRISHDHWDNHKALEEAKLYHMSWMEHAMQDYILRFEPAASKGVPLLSKSGSAPAAP